MIKSIIPHNNGSYVGTHWAAMLAPEGWYEISFVVQILRTATSSGL